MSPYEVENYAYQCENCVNEETELNMIIEAEGLTGLEDDEDQ
jgi:hypothetical protein